MHNAIIRKRTEDNRNLVRLLAPIAGFHAEFKRWPKRVHLDCGHIRVLQNEHLTPAAMGMIEAKIDLVPENDFMDVVAEDDTASYSYAKQEVADPNPASKWLFGISFDKLFD